MRSFQTHLTIAVLSATFTAGFAIESSAAMDFEWAPLNPEIGESVVFSLNGVTGNVSKATWNFGETGCDGKSATQVCTPGLFNDCKAMTFAFATGGTKTVSVAVEIEGGGTTNLGPSSVTVQNFGYCDGGGGGCSYTISPVSAQFTSEGGVGTFSVNTASECAWTATTTVSWINLTTASGVGSGPVGYSVDTYVDTSSRSGPINVLGKSYTVVQDGSVACSNIIFEPGFEAGSGSAWSESSSNGYFLIAMNRPHSGDFSAWLGGADNEHSSVWQTPTIDPMATSAKLTYWHEIDVGEEYSANYGYCGAKINGVFARGHEYEISSDFATDGYVESDFVDLLPYAGTSPEIRFEAFTSSQFGSFYVDDVSLEVCVSTLSDDHVFSDAFESGNTSMWSATVPPLN